MQVLLNLKRKKLQIEFQSNRRRNLIYLMDTSNEVETLFIKTSQLSKIESKNIQKFEQRNEFMEQNKQTNKKKL